MIKYNLKRKLIYSVLLIFNSVFSQDSIIEININQFLYNSEIKLTPNEIISNYRLSEDKWLNNYEYGEELAKFESAYRLNVFDYFSLNDSLDSDLKKMIFSKSSEYQIFRDSLLKIKSDYLKSTYYSRNVLNDYVGSSVQTFEDEFGRNNIYYDINKLGYILHIGSVLPYKCDFSFCPKVLKGIEFKQLPIVKIYNRNNSKRSYNQSLFIPMSPERAIEIENNLKDIEILTVFNIKEIGSSIFSDNDFLTENKGKQCRVKVIKGGAFRLLVYNKLTQEVYIDNLYKE